MSRLQTEWFYKVSSHIRLESLPARGKQCAPHRCGKSAVHNAFWGGYVSEGIIRKMLPHQRINHFPGSMQLGRKDYIWKNLSVQRRSFPGEYDICAKTYLLPKDRPLLARDWDEHGKNAVFIIKPPGSSCGRGIRLAVRITTPLDPSDSARCLCR